MQRLRSFLGGLVLPGVLTVCARAGDAPPAALPAAVVAAPTAIPALTIEAALRTAAEQQPAVAAARASLHAAITRRDAVNSLRVPTFLARDLPVRKQQSELGVAAADAAVRLAQMNASYAAAYSYLSYLYAREQEKVADDAVNSLIKVRDEVFSEPGDGDKKSPIKNPDSLSSVKRAEYLSIEAYRGLAQTRRDEARSGAERALSALREALGLPPDAPLHIIRAGLPDPVVSIDKRALLDLATSRRPELAQAALGVEVADLETCAQGKLSFMAFRATTFAAGTDLHATPLPAGSFDNEYKPAAVGPEYPASINGSKKNRVAQAEAWAVRAGAVVTRTRALIALETDQTYLRWEEAAKRLAGYRTAYRSAQGRVEEIKTAKVPNVPKILEAGSVASQLRAEVNRARFEMVLALAQLERVTAGGFCARLDEAPDAPDDLKQVQKEFEALKAKREPKKDDETGLKDRSNLEGTQR